MGRNPPRNPEARRAWPRRGAREPGPPEGKPETQPNGGKGKRPTREDSCTSAGASSGREDKA